MGQLIDGRWHDQWYDTQKDGRFQRENAQRRHWLGGEEMSLADITAAAHLSTVDYFGDVPWADHKPAKNWYARIKSRPSLRPILAERIPRLPAAKHYSDLDF